MHSTTRTVTQHGDRKVDRGMLFGFWGFNELGERNEDETPSKGGPD